MTADTTAIALASEVSLLETLGLAPPPQDQRRRLLRFPLGTRDSGLLPLADIVEVLQVPLTNVLPVPGVADPVLGLCNWRGNMLWLVDFNALAGYAPLVEGMAGQPLTVLIIRTPDKAMGLGISQFDDIEYSDLTHLHGATPGLFPAQMYPFIAGILPGAQGAVLDASAILTTAHWQPAS